MRTYYFFIGLLFFVALNSCATILAPRNQAINFTKPQEGTSIYLNNRLVNKLNTNGTLSRKIRKTSRFEQITITRDGYVDEYMVTANYSANTWKYVSIIFAPTLILSPTTFVDWYSSQKPHIYRYPTRPFSVPEKMVKKTYRKENQKYLYLTQSSFDVPKEKVLFGNISYRRYYRNQMNKIKYEKPGNNIVDLKSDNTIFSDSMNVVLKKGGFIDTTGKVLKNPLNTMYVKVTTESIKVITVENNLIDDSNKGYITELGLKWEILDTYQQTKYTYNTTAKSGEFSGTAIILKQESLLKIKESEIKELEEQQTKREARQVNPIALGITHALEKSFNELLDKSEVQDLLKYQKDDIKKAEKIKIEAPSKKIASLDNAMEANVTVITENGHGSGFFISENGYIITNFHVIANQKNITVQTNKGAKLDAKLIRVNEFADLALLKIDTKTDYAFSIPSEINFTLGQEVFAIGTPKNIEFGQTITKGIISGKRKREEQEIIQTDASVNNGNSGGALISPKGELLGIVNAKLMGIGVEGIAFAIIAKDIIKYLDITY